MHHQAYRCLLNAFEAFLSQELVHLIFSPLRVIVGSPLEGMTISLSDVADGFLLLASAIADQFGFDFLLLFDLRLGFLLIVY